jgi:hypothetical protein
MREHGKNPEHTGIYSVVPVAKSPNRNGIREFRTEFCRNLQPSKNTSLTKIKHCIFQKEKQSVGISPEDDELSTDWNFSGGDLRDYNQHYG